MQPVGCGLCVYGRGYCLCVGDGMKYLPIPRHIRQRLEDIVTNPKSKPPICISCKHYAESPGVGIESGWCHQTGEGTDANDTCDFHEMS